MKHVKSHRFEDSLKFEGTLKPFRDNTCGKGLPSPTPPPGHLENGSTHLLDGLCLAGAGGGGWGQGGTEPPCLMPPPSQLPWVGYWGEPGWSHDASALCSTSFPSHQLQPWQSPSSSSVLPLSRCPGGGGEGKGAP